jgi:hypothetical protein
MIVSSHPSVLATGLISFWVLLASCGGGDGMSTTTMDDEATGSEGTSVDGSTGMGTGSESLCTPSGVLEPDATRIVEAASVTTSATLLNALENCEKEELEIRLVLDTHTVDLLSYDIVAEASVNTSNGAIVDEGFAWEGGSESSHHRDGILRVTAPSLAGAAWLRLTLPGVAGVDRIFEWDAGLLAHDLP